MDLVERVLAKVFPEEEERMRARDALAAYGDSQGPDIDQVRLAILKLSDGDVQRTAELVQAAKRDFRDVLAYAQSPELMRAGWALLLRKDPESRKQLREIEERDRQQYEEWLAQF